MENKLSALGMSVCFRTGSFPDCPNTVSMRESGTLIAVKSSSIDRNFGLSKLCKRLGDFEPGNYGPEMEAPEPAPVTAVAMWEWREFRKLQAMAARNRREHKKRESVVIANVRDEQHRQRRWIPRYFSRSCTRASMSRQLR